MISLRKKISSSYIIIILITVIIIELILYITIRGYHYGNLKDTIYSQIKISADFYNNYLSSNTVNENIFNNTDMFWRNTEAQVQVIDITGRVLMDSKGDITNEAVITKEFINASKGSIDKNTNIVQFLKDGEKVVSVAYPLYHDKKVDGVLRFMSSTRNIDKSIKYLTFILIFIGISVVIVSTTVSFFIANSILRPLKVVSSGAQKMAKGNFKEKIHKYSDDEIGSLVDTLNYMSGEILKNEGLKNEFIASISHEIRTPLTSIKGWAFVLNSSDLEDKEELKDGLEIIEQETERLTFLVEELLDFSKLISGKISLQREIVDMEVVLNSSLKQMNPRLISKSIKLIKNIHKVSNIEVDGNRIKQVLVNILDNAIKFSSKGGTIIVTLFEEKERILICIEDNGSGISEEDLPKIKEKFYKGKNSNSTNGIGLSICDEIINLHGGNLNIDSQLYRGTKVIISLPREVE